MQDFQAGTKVIISKDGDIWDGSEGTVLDPNTFGEPHTSRWILVQGCVEDEFGLRTGERFYPADALEVTGVTPDEITSFVMDIYDAGIEEAR